MAIDTKVCNLKINNEYVSPLTHGKAVTYSENKNINQAVGDLTTLKTIEKTSAVGAINEINESLTQENEVDNPDFSINQKGAIAYTANATSIYCFDRWKLLKCTASKVVNGIALTPNEIGSYAQVFQIYENPDNLIGKTYTLSAIINGIVYNITKENIQFTSVFDYTVEVSNGIRLYMYRASSSSPFNFGISSYYGTNITIEKVKFEKGNKSTILLDPPPNPQVELAKCQRYLYYLKHPSAIHLGYAMASTTTVANAIIFLPVNQRLSSPTLSNTGTFVLRSGVTDKEITKLSVNAVSGNIAYVQIQSTGLSIEKTYALRATGAFEFGISSEL